MSTRLTRRVVAKSANYTVVFPMDAPGTIFTNQGASGGTTFTLPKASAALLGVEYFFRAVADQSITVATPTADTAVAKNDAAADSLALSTAGEKIGGEIKAACLKTGTSTFQWALSGIAVGHTYTVAT